MKKEILSPKFPPQDELPACPAQNHLDQALSGMCIPLFQLAFPGAVFQLQTWNFGLETPQLNLVWPGNLLPPSPQLQRDGQGSFLSASCTSRWLFGFIFGDIPVGGWRQRQHREKSRLVGSFPAVATQDSSWVTDGCKSHFQGFSPLPTATS